MLINNFINACENDGSVGITHFICVSQNNILAHYCRKPYRMDSLKLFFSMTKSISSLAVGIASDLNLLNIDDFIYTYFEDDLPPAPHNNLFKIKIRHLLTMSSGIHDNTYDDLVKQKNWIKAFLKQDFPHDPGTFYRYSTHSSHMLSALITKVSGLSLEDFLNKYLFYPLNIYEAQWELSPEGLTAGGMGLSLHPTSLAKIAQMLLNHGIYCGKRIISQDYLQYAATPNIAKQDTRIDEDIEYSGTEYGFQFHIGKDGFYRADGAFGQLCLICPSKNLAFIVFSQYSKMENLLKLLYKHFLENDKQIEIQKQKTSDRIPSQAIIVPEAKYEIEENILGIKLLEFSRTDNVNLMKIIKECGREDYIYYNFSAETQGNMYFVKDLQEHYQQYVCYANYSDLLELNIFFIETPYVVKYRISFMDSKIELNFSINVSFTLKDFSVQGVPCSLTEVKHIP